MKTPHTHSLLGKLFFAGLLAITTSAFYGQGSQHFFYPGGATNIQLNSVSFYNHVLNGDKIASGGFVFENAWMPEFILSASDTVGNLSFFKGYQDGQSFTLNSHGFAANGTGWIGAVGQVTGTYSGMGSPACGILLFDAAGNMTNSRYYSPITEGACCGWADGYVAKPLPAGAGGTYMLAGEASTTNSGAGTSCGTVSYPVFVAGDKGFPSSKDIFYIKTDAALDTVLTKRYSLNYNFTCGVSTDSVASEFIRDVLVQNAALMFTGTRVFVQSNSPLRFSNEGFLLKTDFNGNVLWSRTYYTNSGAPNYTPYTYFYSVVDVGSDYIVLGYDYNMGEVVVMRVDGSNGNPIWTKSYAAAFGINDLHKVMRDNQDGNYIISGTAASNGNDMLMFKIDPATGNVINTFTKMIGGTGSDGASSGWGIGGGTVMQSANGTYFLAGASSGSFGGVGYMFARLDKTSITSGCNETTGPITATNRSFTVRTPVVRTFNGYFQPYQPVWTAVDYTGVTSAVTICSVTPLSINSSKTDLTCNGAGTGSATVNVVTGTPNFTYSWSSGPNSVTSATSNTISNLAAGTYSVTVTSSSGTSSVTSVTITQPTAVAATASATQNVSCSGGSNGVATATGSGGTGAISYSWSTGPTSASISGLTAGTYTVTVRDASNCSAVSTVTLTAPPFLDLSTSLGGNVSCFGGNNGSATASATGGTPTLSYSWTPGALIGATQTSLSANVYTVQVTDGNGCTRTTSVTITQPSSAVTAATSVANNVSCFSGNNGSASATGSGGTSGYSYSWSNGPTAQTITGLAASTYTVTITDANSCSATSTVTITQPSAALSGTAAATQTACNPNTGTASATPAGGTSAYSYSWSGGSTSQTATGLAAGTYVVTITDANSCTATTSAVVTTVTGPSATSSKTDASCGTSTGSATASGSGGTGGYTYSWSNGGTTALISNIPSGSYVATVTDANGCTATTTATVSDIGAATITLQGQQDNVCFGGSIGTATVSATGGTGTLNYSWSTGATTTTVGNLGAGSYVVSVTDQGGCLATSNITITSPAAVAPTANVTSNVGCMGGSNGVVSVTGSGGTPGYSYSWSAPGGTGSSLSNLAIGTYTVTVTDLNGCSGTSTVTLTQPSSGPAVIATSTNTGCGISTGSAVATGSGGTPGYNYTWSSGDVGATANNLAAGSYIVTVSDLNGCTSTTTTAVVASGAPILDPSGGATICVGQSTIINAVPIGGTPAYTFSWSDGLTGAGPHTVNPTTTTTYTVNVTDASACTSATYSITVTVNPPLTLSITNAVQSICTGSTATITANVSGGTGNYTYTWQPGGETTASISVSPTAISTYTVTVDDNCTSPVAVATATVNVNQPPTVDLSAPNTSGCGTPFCVQFTSTSTGSCTNELWSFGDGNTSTSANPNHCYTIAGSFDVSYTCTDANGCVGTISYPGFVNVTAAPVADFTYTPTPVVKQVQVQFTDASTIGSSLLWDFGDQNSGVNNTSVLTNPAHTYNDTGTYCVMLVASMGGNCVDTTIKCMYVNDVCEIPDSIPNVFSPNADAVNDLFLIKSSGLSELICTIYNRWGLKLYEYNAIKTGWDGRTFTDLVAPAGTYFYILKATCVDVNVKLEGHGSLQLVR